MKECSGTVFSFRSGRRWVVQVSVSVVSPSRRTNISVVFRSPS